MTRFLVQKIYRGYFGYCDYKSVFLRVTTCGTKMDKFILSLVIALATYGAFCLLFWVLTFLGTLCYSLLSWQRGILSFTEVMLYVVTWFSCFIIWRLVIWND